MVPDAGLEIFLIAVVRGRGKLELFRHTGRVGQLREDDHVADSGRRLRPVVETVYEDRVEGLRFHLLSVHYARHIGRRQGVGVAAPQARIDGSDLFIDGPDCLGVGMGHDKATIAVVCGAWAARLLRLILHIHLHPQISKPLHLHLPLGRVDHLEPVK